MSRRFEKKVSLITGSSRGIGRALALTLAREGATIVVNYVRNAELAAQTVREIEALGSRAIAVQANMENADEIDRLFDRVAAEFGALDHFVSNAAASSFKKIADLKAHNLDRSFDLNVRAFVLGAQRAVKLMNARRTNRRALQLRQRSSLPDVREPRIEQSGHRGVGAIHGR